MDVGIKELKSLIVEVIAEQDGEPTEEDKLKNILQKTNDYAKFMNAASRLYKLIRKSLADSDGNVSDEQFGPFERFSQVQLIPPNREQTQPPQNPETIIDVIENYRSLNMPGSLRRAAGSQSGKLDPVEIEKAMKAFGRIQSIFKLNDLNLASRPGLFGVNSKENSAWVDSLKKYKREKESGELQQKGEGEGDSIVPQALLTAFNQLKTKSADLTTIADPDFAKLYGKSMRALNALIQKNAKDPEAIKSIVPSGYIAGGEDVVKFEEFANLIKRIVKGSKGSGPESNMTKLFILMRKYHVLNDGKKRDKVREQILKVKEAALGPLDLRNSVDVENETKNIFRLGADRIVRNPQPEDTEEIEESLLKEEEINPVPVLSIFKNISKQLFGPEGDELAPDPKAPEAFEKFEDKSSEEDTAGFRQYSRRTQKQQIAEFLKGFKKALETGEKLEVVKIEGDDIKLTGFPGENLPSLVDVKQGTVGIDKEDRMEFNEYWQDKNNTASEQERPAIQKQARAATTVLIKVIKMYQIANRGLLGKFLDSDTLPLGASRWFGGKKVTESLLYGNPSKLLVENKQQISRLYVIAINETLNNMKNERALGISDEYSGLELQWLIEDIKNNNISNEVLFYLKKKLINESKDRDDHVNAAFNAIEFYEEGFGGEEPTRNSRQALGGLANLISKGIVACIKQGSSHASAQMELINKAKELGIFDEVAESVIDLSKEDVSPEIRLKENLLQEDAKGPQDLPEDVYVRVFVRGREGGTGTRMITVMLTDKDGNMIGPVNHKTDEDNPAYGDVSFYEKNPDSFECDDASVIAVTQAADGWGPFLYDIAMEIATMNSNGLASDRLTVSPEAQDVWDYYSKFRSDVKSYQLDDEYNSLTPEDSDNCRQNQSRERAEDYGGEWNDNALSKRFTKEPTTLNQIRDKLIWEI